MSPTYRYMTKLFLELEFQHKGNKPIKKANSQQNLAVFLAGTDSEKNYLNTTQKRSKNIWTKLSSLGQEPTFNVKRRWMMDGWVLVRSPYRQYFSHIRLIGG